MKFEKYISESNNSAFKSAFKKVLSAQEFANMLKKEYKVGSVRISQVIDNGQGNFIIITLENGQSTTMPVSKKASAGDSVVGYMFCLTEDNTWLVSTSSSNDILL